MDSRRLVLLRSKLSYDVLSKAVSLRNGLSSITRSEEHVDKGVSKVLQFRLKNTVYLILLSSVGSCLQSF